MKDNLRQFVLVNLIDQSNQEEFSDNLNLLRSGLDSMGVMRLVRFIEERWHIQVPPEDVTIDNFMNINTIASYVEHQLGENQS